MRFLIACLLTALMLAQGAKAQMTTNDMVQVQGLLHDMGYDPNGVDGRMGPGTQRAIRQFQADRGMPVTGVPDAALLAELRALHGRGWYRGADTNTPPKPGFDCARASTVTEITICNSNVLAGLDRRMTKAYTAARKRSGGAALAATQRSFIQSRNRCGADVQCIMYATEQRLRELK